MPVQRDADGNIIEEETKIGGTFRQVIPTLPAKSPVDVGNDPGVEAGNQSGYEARTVVAGSTGPAEEQGAKTRIYRAAKTAGEEPGAALSGIGQDVSPSVMDDPPVGWLVVVRGAGQGRFVAIGNGSNSIGREQDERIRIDFGDETISRRGHSTITYDPRGRKFYLQHGAGKNLTYLEGAPVLAPTELVGFSRITIGDTELLFVPLCCDQFDWAEYT